MKLDKNSNIALYRKYRPENWEEVIGQDHIVKAIGGAIEAGKVSHAYLLCGPRGTGKTTIARIIASELGSSVNDIYELDAASNRGIDDVRNIRESVNTMPFDSKYKIYILDEVHMFTKDAWNALLKTIEEPPKHVIFILATTELEKVPETIISRCQTFIFKKPTDAVLAQVIENVAEKEGYTLEEGGADLIALLADGAFRDALGTLQKVISFSKDKKIKIKEIEDVTGSPKEDLVNGFLDAIAENDLEKGLLSIKKANEENIDMEIYLKMILSKLRFSLMLRYVPTMKNDLNKTLSLNDINYISSLVSSKPEKISSHTLYILLESYGNLKNSFITSLPLELALIKIINEGK
ncbi:TPA: DNA polymerase III subunit gamma/tau [Candidatus Nomurabacteria bacterium]|nr:MAG: DNA polymerase III, subunit gamma and tau [Parcubacteria bacterium RAAC4_OD1_1]HCY26400.1 DNA polymerase III subunit gamma/tau [Candidatus Nomurabacteria bacterium]